MPDLKRCLLDYDAGLLRIIAELWGLELHAPNQRDAAGELAGLMLQAELAAEVYTALPEAARAALAALRRTGRMPLAQFVRQFGELRAMGQARRDREQPWLNQPTVAETLWYRGLVARAFLAEGGQAPEEFVFIPDDLAAFIPADPEPAQARLDLGEPLAPPLGPATAGRAPDDLATLLAYLQIAAAKLEGASLLPRHREALSRFLRYPDALDWLIHLAIRRGLAGGVPLKPDPSRTRPYLESSREAQVRALAAAWRESREWNDLLHVPGLVFEGAAWHNDSLAARQAILALLRDVAPGCWWPVEALVAAVKARRPDFQRPGGDYESWYIRDAATRNYLRGFEYWDQVDGALVRWLIQKPLYWLGIVEAVESAFSVTAWGARFLSGTLEETPGVEPAAAPAPLLAVSADGTLHVAAAASGYDRFQVARVCNWLPMEQDNYVYRLSPASLARAAKQSIKVNHILTFLQKSVGESTLPPALVGALRRWERVGPEAAVKETVVLKLKNPELLETLLRTPGVSRYFGERLGPALVEVRAAEVGELRRALVELGLLVD
jgi:hypothetical protein